MSAQLWLGIVQVIAGLVLAVAVAKLTRDHMRETRRQRNRDADSDDVGR